MNSVIIAGIFQLSQANSQSDGQITASGSSDSPWYDKIIHDPVNLISISLAIIGVILGLIPLVLYIFEKRKSVLLDQTIKEFALLEKIREMKADADAESKLSKDELTKIKREALIMREEVEQRIPNSAMIAYYENTIPQIEYQVLDLGTRLVEMTSSVNKLRSSPIVVNPRVERIISQQISKTVGARRSLEQLQIFLIISTSFSSALLAILPYPLSILAAIPATFLIIYVCYRLTIAARIAFPDNRVLSMWFFKSRVIAIAMLLAVLFVIIVGLFLTFLRHGFYID